MKLVFIVFVLFYLNHALAGGEITSTGGEFITTEKNPWFVGDEPVTYCVQSSNDFSLELSQVKDLTQEVIKDWTSTLKKMSINETYFILPDGQRKSLSTEFIYEECGDKTQLRFLYGIYNKDIETTLKTKSRYTAAFAGHHGIDDFSGLAKKGFVWFVPDRGARKYIGPKLTNDFWSAPPVFKNVLLHEMGHVFGFGHHPDGIMNEGYPGFTVQHGGVKSSSDELLDHKWPYVETKACNSNVQIDKGVARSLLKTNLIILWDICIESTKKVIVQNKRNFEIVFTDLYITFTSEKNIVEKKFRFNILGSSGFSSSLNRSIIGKYFENKIKGPSDYGTHYFISFYDTRFIGEIEDLETGEYYAAFLSKNGNAIELNYSVERSGYSLNFFLGNLPTKLSEIKNRLDNK